MTFAGGQYYRLSYVLLTSLGLWPYRSSRLRYVHVAVLLCILICGINAQLLTLVTRNYSVDDLLRVLAYCGPWISYTVKYIMTALKTVEIKKIMNTIQHDWTLLKNEDEIKIMQSYGARAKFIVFVSAQFFYVSTMCFVLGELLPDFLDYVAPLNESRQHKLWAPIETFVDEEKYFAVILFCVVIFVLIGISTVIASESIVFLYIEHICAMSEVACSRVKSILNENYLRSTVLNGNVAKVYESVIDVLKMNDKTLETLYTILSTFKLSYFFLLPLGVATLSVNFCRLYTLSGAEQLGELFVTALFIFGHFWYFLFCNYIGQTIMDRTAVIFKETYNTDWYVAPVKVQKLVLLILQRALLTPKWNVSSIYVASLQGFVTMVNMSFSYYMLIRSLQ